MDILKKENILANATLKSKDEAIELAGKMLIDGGYVTETYIELMKKREEMLTTYIGNGLAIPHGVVKGREEVIIKSGIVVIQIPKGLDFGEGNIAYFVVGIAGKDNEHLEILSKLAIAFSVEEKVKEMVTYTSSELFDYFTKEM